MNQGNYAKTEKGKATRARYMASEKGKAAKQRMQENAKGKQYHRIWRETHPKRTWCSMTLSNMRKRAKAWGLAFDLDVEYLVSITPDECPCFGTPFSFVGNGRSSPESPSLDKIKPSLGYVRGNVQVISLKANQIKNAYAATDVATVAAWMRAQEGYY